MNERSAGHYGTPGPSCCACRRGRPDSHSFRNRSERLFSATGHRPSDRHHPGDQSISFQAMRKEEGAIDGDREGRSGGPKRRRIHRQRQRRRPRLQREYGLGLCRAQAAHATHRSPRTKSSTGYAANWLPFPGLVFSCKPCRIFAPADGQATRNFNILWKAIPRGTERRGRQSSSPPCRKAKF